MDKNKVDMFLMTNARYFPTNQVMLVKQKLEQMNEDKFVMLQSINFKDATSTVLFGVLLGADRIYLGEIGVGILKIILMFLVVGLIRWLIDLFTLTKRTHDYNMNEFVKTTMLF